MRKLANELRTESEKIYGILTLVSGALLWVIILIAVKRGLTSTNPNTLVATKLYIGYGVAFALFIVISAAFYRALAFGNMILLGPRQFPELHAMVVSGATALGMDPPPKAFLYNSNGLFNAFARRLFGGRYVFLTSALVEATSDEQVRFVIGHELGHHAAGHLNPWRGLIRFPTRFILFLFSAYSRAREFTCDRIGAHLSRDVAASQSSLQMLGCGCRRLNEAMNCSAFLEQEEMVPPISGFFVEIFRSHPRLTRRVSAIADRQREYGVSTALDALQIPDVPIPVEGTSLE